MLAQAGMPGQAGMLAQEHARPAGAHGVPAMPSAIAPNPDPFVRGPMIRSLRFLWIPPLAAALLSACGPTADQVQSPARLLYLQGQQLEDGGLLTDAADKFDKMVQQNRGTRLAGNGYLRLAEIYSRQKDWIKAETHYRLFLGANPNSHLNAYVIYRLLKVNDQKSYTGVFFPEREVDRDMEPNRQIMLEYKRFYLLHPNSIYLEEAVPIYRDAQNTLAQHEIIVADFYFRRKLFHAAATRYLYVLRAYTGHVDAKYALAQLIESYRLDQQPDLADEMQRIYDAQYGGKQSTKGSSKDGAAGDAPAPRRDG
jgi:outer membrane protein assembly factor BamD